MTTTTASDVDATDRPNAGVAFLRRLTPIAGIAVFLASHASDFLTGAAIPLDGGYSTLL